MAERYKFTDPNPSAADHDEEDDNRQPQPASGGSRPAAVPVAGPGGERLDREVQRAQEQLLSLKRQQELIERQKRELEELSRRQEELERGKGEMTEKLTRALAILDRQTTEAQKRVEQLRATTESFSNHLHALESIQPKIWPGNEMPKELNRALSLVDHARSEFNQSRARIQTDPNASPAAQAAEGANADAAAAGDYEELFHENTDKSFLHWLKAGLAFTLPLLILGLLALATYCWLTLSAPHP